LRFLQPQCLRPFQAVRGPYNPNPDIANASVAVNNSAQKTVINRSRVYRA
jgi:hypothetical protein